MSWVRFPVAPQRKFPRMLFKLKQQISRYRFTESNRLPNRRARLFLVNHLRLIRNYKSAAIARAALGLTV